MTLTDLQSKRDKILAQMGVRELQRENYRIVFSSGDDRLKELALIDAEMDKLRSGPTSMSRFTSHSRG
jgi:hypothetical protein